MRSTDSTSSINRVNDPYGKNGYDVSSDACRRAEEGLDDKEYPTIKER